MTIAELFRLEWAENSEKNCAKNALIIVRIVNARQFSDINDIHEREKNLSVK